MKRKREDFVAALAACKIKFVKGPLSDPAFSIHLPTIIEALEAVGKVLEAQEAMTAPLPDYGIDPVEE